MVADEDAAPPDPEAAAPPLVPPLLEAAPPGEEDAAPPAPELLVPPVAPAPAVPPVVELEADPGELGAVVVLEDEDEPPGTTTVSFSFVVVDEVADPLAPVPPPGTTVVVSLRSQPESANAPNSTNR